jgi:hypothetical protein
MPEELSDVDWSRCTNYMFVQFNAWEYLYYQHHDGSIPKELWVGADAFHKSLVETKPGFVRFWAENQSSFDEPFRSYVAHEFARRPVASEKSAPETGCSKRGPNPRQVSRPGTGPASRP